MSPRKVIYFNSGKQMIKEVKQGTLRGVSRGIDINYMKDGIYVYLYIAKIV